MKSLAGLYIAVTRPREQAEELQQVFVARGHEVFLISAVSHEGLKPLIHAAATRLAESRDVGNADV